MLQSRVFITRLARCFMLLGIIVFVHGQVQGKANYSPVFSYFNREVEVFKEIFINKCLVNVTARTYNEREFNKNIDFQLGSHANYFEIDENGCLKMKPELTISIIKNRPIWEIDVIAKNTQYPQFYNRTKLNIKFQTSEINVNSKLITTHSSYWFNPDDDHDDVVNKYNIIGISETIEPYEPILTLIMENENKYALFNDINGIFYLKNNKLYAKKDKLDFKSGNGIGMRDFDLTIVATNDDSNYNYQTVRIKILRSRGPLPILGINKKILMIEEEKKPEDGCIADLIARDPDESINSKIYYEILDPSAYFIIENNGCLKLNETFDHECEPINGYNCPPNQLKISAYFEGHLLEQVISIGIEIIDINDNAPELNITNVIMTESKKSKLVAKLTAIDKDLPQTNGNLFFFQIDYNDPKYRSDSKKFIIKNGNELYNVEPLIGKVKKSKYEIPITVSDNGNSSKSNVVIFTVEVNKANQLKLSHSNFVAFVSENAKINTPVTKYFWVTKNVSPVEFQVVDDFSNSFSVTKFYDSDANIYYAQIIVSKKIDYASKFKFVNISIKASDNSSSDISNVRIYFKKSTESGIEWSNLNNLYSQPKNITKDSKECIATVKAIDKNFPNGLVDNPIFYNISDVSSERYLGSSSYSDGVVSSLFVKIDKFSGCIQIQKYDGLWHNDEVVIRAYYKDDYSEKPSVSRYLLRIRLENPTGSIYTLSVTDETQNKQ